MRLLAVLFSFFVLATAGSKEVCEIKDSASKAINSNQCIQFSVSSGTGCAWMCNYCANQLGTNNYYFTDNVCVYQAGQGCVGNPIAGKTYTCCSV